MKRGRYGRFIKLAITVVDFCILNIVYIAIGFIFKFPTDFFNFKICGYLNLSYLISVYLFSDVHEQRTMYVDKILLAELKLAIIFAAIFFTLIFISSSNILSASPIYCFFISFILFLGLWWLVMRRAVKLFRSHGFNFKRVIIIGSGKMGNRLLDEMVSDSGYGYKVMGFFDDNFTSINKETIYKGGINEVDSFVKNNLIDEMYCTIADDETDLLLKLMKISESNAIDFYYVPQVSSMIVRRFELHTIGDIPALTVRPNPLNKTFNHVIKRLFDVAFSGSFLIFSPLILIPIAIGIKLTSPGPIFFKQLRTGYRGKDFMCYKFRTMKVNNDSDIVQTTKDDPRKTKFGDFLRKTSLDELPQFYNVFIGNMSIVGPRPHMLKHTQDYSKLVDKYMLRHTVRPGITGWAQVNGFRGETKELWLMQKRVEYDVWYAENWNLMLDIKIIVKTVFNALRGEKNAF